MDALVELVDRQMDFLLGQTASAAFLIQIEPFLGALRAEPRLAAYLDDVLEELADMIEAIEAADRGLTGELVELRRALVELWLEADDSDVKPPSPSEPPAAKLQARLRYRSSLAYFDKWTESEPQPFNADGEGGLAKRLLGILQGKDTAYLHEREAAAAGETAKAVSNPDDVAADTPRSTLSRTGQATTSWTGGDDDLRMCSVATTMPCGYSGCGRGRLRALRWSSWRPFLIS